MHLCGNGELSMIKVVMLSVSPPQYKIGLSSAFRLATLYKVAFDHRNQHVQRQRLQKLI